MMISIRGMTGLEPSRPREGRRPRRSALAHENVREPASSGCRRERLAAPGGCVPSAVHLTPGHEDGPHPRPASTDVCLHSLAACGTPHPTARPPRAAGRPTDQTDRPGNRPVWESSMMTVVTTTRLRPGGEDEWDAAVRTRFESAHDRPGWVSGQLLTPTDEPHTRVIVGTWQSRDDWEAWHHDPAFLEQRSTLERLEEQSRTEWYEVVADARHR